MTPGDEMTSLVTTGLFTYLPLWQKLTFMNFYTQTKSCTSVNGQKMIILSSSKGAVGLLDKRSATYSIRRPVGMMCGEIIRWKRVYLSLNTAHNSENSEELKQVDQDARKYREKFSIAEKEDCQVRGEGYS